jgi:hypothetical protein
MEHLPLAQKLQSIEAHLTSLEDSLQQGKFPVNIKKISQVFDKAITEIPRLSLPPEKFCTLYNDIPIVLSAYAITVTLSVESYRQTQNTSIVFERLYNGNYWIIPLAATPNHAWLVLNPTRKIDLPRLNSLPFAFDWEEPGNLSDQTTFSLLEPALVSILPTENLTWKLIQRGILSSFLNPDAQQQNQAVNGESSLNIEQMVEQAVKVRLSILEKQIFARLTAQMKVEIQEFQAGSIDKNNSDYNFSNNTDSTPAPKPESLGDLWRQSLTDMMIFGDDNVPEVETSDKSIAQNIENEINSQSFDRTTGIDRSMPLQEQIIDGEFVQLVTNSNNTKFDFKNIQFSPLAKMYNSGAENFLRAYIVIEASIMRRDIDSSMVELVEDRVGIYWIIPFDKSKYYLVPKIDFPNEDRYLQGLANLFDGDNNQFNSGLFKPAIINITKTSMPKQWKLESKGVICTI